MAALSSSLGLSSSLPSIANVHSLMTLSEYAHTLDSLPLDLSRQFADLRELDAVLSASTHSVTQKIYELIDLVESPHSTKEQRLSKLVQIGEEAQRLKLGGEDKIKVASQAADNLMAHKSHMNTLLTTIAQYDTSFTPAHLYLRTTYPHIPPRPPQDIIPLENGRRRRAAANAGRGQLGGMLAVEALSPVKSRKRVREEEESAPTPRKEREPTAAASHRRGGASAAKSRKAEQQTLVHVHAHRAGSPSADSVLSVTSHPVNHPSTARVPAAAAVPPRTTVVQQDVAPAPEEVEQDGGDEQDGGRYCYCHGHSYGEMVGCDDEQCAFEWFHLACIGLTNAPKAGTWYCDDCKAKRAGNKKGRNGKRRAGGAAASAGAKSGRGRA
ncbi:hypothetical protein BU17DRAFT_63668 [Hysterangium stoloniferum]|nr:hypothetical protein BU17DRAFT_63668 [Hysterangium stoloniferum]